MRPGRRQPNVHWQIGGAPDGWAAHLLLPGVHQSERQSDSEVVLAQPQAPRPKRPHDQGVSARDATVDHVIEHAGYVEADDEASAASAYVRLRLCPDAIDKRRRKMWGVKRTRGLVEDGK